MAPSFCKHRRVRFSANSQTRRVQHAVPDVFAFRVVEHFNIVEHVLVSFTAWTVDPATYLLSLQMIEEAPGTALS